MNKRNLISISMVLAVSMIMLALVFVARQDPLTKDKQLPRPQGEVASIFKNKNIRFLVPSEPGGGFDEYVRLLAPFFEQYTGARVNVINLPGAGGMRAVNELYRSPNNGLTIGIVNGTAMITNQLAGIKGAQYDIEAFEYLGRVVTDTRIFVVPENSGYKTIDDIRHASEIVKIGATGLGGAGYVDSVITKEAFGLNVQIIHGFDSSSGIRQAMLRGSLAGAWGSWGSAEGAVKSGSERILLQSGKARIKDLADVPTAFEFTGKAENPERAHEILAAWDAMNSAGRPLAAPPGTPEDIILFLRAAFEKTMHDPELLRVSEAADRPLDYATGEEILEIIRNATRMKTEIRQLFISAVRGEL